MPNSNRMLVLFSLLMLATMAGADPLISGDVAAGQKKATTCAACHGPRGNSSNPKWPSLAGQHATYLLRQLKHFKSGARQNAVMAAQVSSLTLQDMKALAVYYAQQPLNPTATKASRALLARGSKIYRTGDPEQGIPACAGCHGPAGMGNAAAVFPRISGQQAPYLIDTLKAYRAGKRSGYAKAEIMTGVANNMSNEAIKAVAAYIQSLRLKEENR